MIKWHDVTKNPSDLPKPNANGDYKDVAVVNEIEGIKYGFIARYDDKRGKWFQYKTDYEVTSEMGDEESEDRIICWAYLDGDGEEEPEPSPRHDLSELRDSLIASVDNANSKINEFAVSARNSGDGVSETLACVLIRYMGSELKYAIMKELAKYGK